MEPILVMRNIHKSFAGIVALRGASLTVNPGEVVGLVGENGAGKSTLLKILSGYSQYDKGEIFINGQAVTIKSPRDAINLGVSMIYQEPELVLDLSVGENIFLGQEPCRNGFIDWEKIKADGGDILSHLHAEIDTRTIVRQLSVADMQLVELARTIMRTSKIIIMDEVTSSLNPQEVNSLFDIIHQLKKKNVGIIFVSHRMNELLSISDRIIVMRDGITVGSLLAKDINEADVVKMMIGSSELIDQVEQNNRNFGDVVLEVSDVCAERALSNINFAVRQGEILGLTGVRGSGLEELVQVLSGQKKKESGTIRFMGQTLHKTSPKTLSKLGVALIPENRKKQGLILCASVVENTVLNSLDQVTKFGFLNRRLSESLYQKFASSLGIVAKRIDAAVAFLSGGNQQKVVMAKCLASEPKILIAHEPTRGIDVQAKAQIRAALRQLASDGLAILYVSSETKETLRISDRILVVFEGKITRELKNENIDEEEVMLYATGGHS